MLTKSSCRSLWGQDETSDSPLDFSMITRPKPSGVFYHIFLYIDSNQHLSILLFFCCSAYQYQSKNKFGSEIYKISMKLSRAWIYFSLQRSSKKNSPIHLKNTHIVKYNLFCKGHVISARITSENPDEGFKPTSGTVQEIIAFRVRGGNV